MEVSVNHVAKTKERSCLGRCKHFFWLGVTFDTVGAATLFTGVFSRLPYYDMFLYLGASMIFLSLLWWTFWYSGNIELSSEESLNSPYRLPSASTLEVLSQTINNRFTLTIGSVSNSFMRMRRRRRRRRQRFLEGQTSLDMTVTGQVENQLDQDKDREEGAAEKGEAQDFGSKDLPKPEAIKSFKEACSQTPDAGDLGREASLPKFVKGPSTSLVKPFTPSPLDQPPTPVILTSKSLPVVSLASMSQTAPILTSKSQPVVALASTSQPLATTLVSMSQLAAPLASTSQPPPLLTSSQSVVSLAVVSSTSQPPLVTLASTRQPAVPLTSTTQPQVVFASKSLPVVSLSFASQPLTILSSQNYPLMPVTSQSQLPVPVASEGHPLVPRVSQSYPLVLPASQSQLPVPMASEGHPLVPVASEGHSLVPVASEGHALVPVASEGHPLIPVASEGHALAPVASEGHPLAPVASEGHPLAPVASEGHPLVPRVSQSYPLVPRTSPGQPLVPRVSQSYPLVLPASEGHPLAPVASEGHRLAPVASEGHPLAPVASEGHPLVPVASEGHPLVPVTSQRQLQNLLEVCQTGPPPLQASQSPSLATISLLQVLPTESLQTQSVDLQVAQPILELQTTYHTQQASQSTSLVQEIRPSQPPSAQEFHTEPVAVESPPPADQELSQDRPDAAALPPQSPAPATQAQQSEPSGLVPTLAQERKSRSI